MEQKRKLLYWEGSSKKDFKEFPIDVQKDMGVALFIVQLGSTPDSAKPWKGLGSGVYELVEDHRGDTFRAVYTVKVGDAVHVLHAFQKKSRRTAPLDVQVMLLRAIVPANASLTFWANPEQCRWVPRRDLGNAALPSVMRKAIAHALKEH